MNSNALAVIDAVGAAAVFTAAPRAPGALKWILYAFGAYAAYGAVMHATRQIKITRS